MSGQGKFTLFATVIVSGRILLSLPLSWPETIDGFSCGKIRNKLPRCTECEWGSTPLAPFWTLKSQPEDGAKQCCGANRIIELISWLWPKATLPLVYLVTWFSKLLYLVWAGCLMFAFRITDRPFTQWTVTTFSVLLVIVLVQHHYLYAFHS